MFTTKIHQVKSSGGDKFSILTVAAGSDMSKISLDGLNVAEQRVLLVGYGVLGKQVCQEIVKNSGLVVAIADDSYQNEAMTEEASFYQIDFLRQAILKHHPTLLIVAASLFTAHRLHEIAVAAKEAAIPMVIVPERAEFHVNEIKNISLRSPTLEDLFARSSLLIDFEEIRERLAGARILVSGAGGSIGSRIALHSLALGASSVGLLDRDDCLLHDIAVEMTGKMHDSRVPLFVSDVQFGQSLGEVFKEFRPDIVIHAAAQKHVTTLENKPQNALAINVLGTMNMLRSSEMYGVREFINISTDKAASQDNILGLSKYLTERLTSGAAIQHSKSVRFGNVLGSRASVLHTFRLQAQFFSKLTVRGDETTRFFMTNNEAASLSLSTLASNEVDGTFVFNMGQSVRILDLAREIARAESTSIEIIVENLLNGEVEHEQLFRPEENPVETAVSNVFRVDPSPLSMSTAESLVKSVDEIYNMTSERARAVINSLLES